MQAILTGDIISSTGLSDTQRENLEAQIWNILSDNVSSEKEFYISRGDAFQLKPGDPAEALRVALKIRSQLKILPIADAPLDARLSIGLGEISLKGQTLSSSDGTAFQRSGRGLDELKNQPLALAVSTGVPQYDKAFEALCYLADEHIRNWSRPQAEAVLLRLQNLTYEQMGRQLQINTSAAYKRLDAAHWKAVSKADEYFRFVVQQLQTDR